jgi:hypothetical protein
LKLKYYNAIGFLGFIISVFGTIIFGLGINKSEFIESLSFLIWSLGMIIITGWWFKLEKRIKVRFSMVILLSGQIMLFLFSESIFNKNYVNNLSILVFLVLFTGSILFFKWSRRNYRMRQNFRNSVKKIILEKQRNRCAKCHHKLSIIQFDHKDGNRFNNETTNCQALCPNCHAIKTLKEIKK